MVKKIWLLFFMLILIPFSSALDNLATQGESYDVRVTPTANGSIDSVLANITINDPNGNVIVSFQEMQKNSASQDFNYTLDSTNTTLLGLYDCTVYA